MLHTAYHSPSCHSRQHYCLFEVYGSVCGWMEESMGGCVNGYIDRLVDKGSQIGTLASRQYPDRQTDRHTCKEAAMQAGRQTYRNTDINANRCDVFVKRSISEEFRFMQHIFPVSSIANHDYYLYVYIIS